MAGWPGGRVAGWPGGRVAGWPGGRVAGWPGGRVAGWPGGRVAGWPGGRVAGWPGGRVEGKSGVFVVRGEQTRKMDGVAPITRAVVLSIQIQHHPDGKSMVEEVKDITPNDGGTDSSKENGSAKGDASPEAGAVAGGSAKGEDPFKAVGDGVKAYQSAVSTAGDAKSATDKMKGILGF